MLQEWPQARPVRCLQEQFSSNKEIIHKKVGKIVKHLKLAGDAGASPKFWFLGTGRMSKFNHRLQSMQSFCATFDGHYWRLCTLHYNTLAIMAVTWISSLRSAKRTYYQIAGRRAEELYLAFEDSLDCRGGHGIEAACMGQERRLFP